MFVQFVVCVSGSGCDILTQSLLFLLLFIVVFVCVCFVVVVLGVCFGCVLLLVFFFWGGGVKIPQTGSSGRPGAKVSATLAPLSVGRVLLKCGPSVHADVCSTPLPSVRHCHSGM